jgi:hypothetical protein
MGPTGWGMAATGIPVASTADAASASGEFSLIGGPHKRMGWLPGGPRLIGLERVGAVPAH